MTGVQTCALPISIGVTHVDLNTMRAGFTTPAEHIAAVRRFAEVLEVA